MTTATQNVDTKKVRNRRKVRYNSFTDLLDDAEKLATVKVRTLGNWSQGQIYRHIAEAMHACIDGFPFQPPLPIKVMGRILKPVILRFPMPPGYKLPPEGARLLPPPVSVEEGLAALREGVGRMRRETKRVPSPLVGSLSLAQWEQFQCRHAEGHMSFIVPE